MARLQRQPEIPNTLGRDWTEVLAAMTARDTADRPTAAEASLLLRALATGTEDQAVATLVLPASTVSDAAPTEVLKADPAPKPKPATAAISWKQTGTKPAATTHSRRAILWTVAAALVVAMIALGALFLRGGGEPAVVPPNYPAVEGPLGTHLEQLQKSVNP
jgi:hypothetical protein